jgi:hypothetical protein
MKLNENPCVFRVKGYAVDFEQVPPTYKFPEAPHYWAQIRSACLEFPDLDVRRAFFHLSRFL